MCLSRPLIWDTTCQKWKSGFSGFPDQPVWEIRKFLQIPNGLAKTFNLRYYMPKVKNPDFRIRLIRKSGNFCGFRTGLPRPLIWDTTCQKWKIRFFRISGSGFRIRSGASIGSSSDGQDEAIDTPSMSVGRLGGQMLSYNRRIRILISHLATRFQMAYLWN